MEYAPVMPRLGHTRLAAFLILAVIPILVAPVILASLLIPAGLPIPAGFRIPAAAPSALASAGPDLSPPENSPGDRVGRLSVDGRLRSYLLHLPPGPVRSAGWPVVFFFHGAGGTGREAARDDGWLPVADSAGFVLVFPDGSRPDSTQPASFRLNPQTWNDGSTRDFFAVRQRIDDVAFVRRLLAALVSRLPVDSDRVYATGFSNGASFTFRLGRELSGVFAAIAPVAGTDWMEERLPDRALPLLYINGTADPINPLAGGEVRVGGIALGTKPPVRAFLSRWVRMAGCAPDSQILRRDGGVTGIGWRSGHGQAEVLFYTVEGLGHCWPGGSNHLPASMVGPSSERLRGAVEIWRFFRRHVRDHAGADGGRLLRPRTMVPFPEAGSPGWSGR